MLIKSSPWGEVQHQGTLAEGIYRVHTAGHGGLVLSPERLAAMPSRFKLNAYGKGRFFEEDCEWALVVLAFPGEFSAAQVASATDAARCFYPSLTQGGTDAH